MTQYNDRLRKTDYKVETVPMSDARDFIATHHYAKGCSNTAVYRHGLIRVSDGALVGVVLWLPPTKNACRSVDRARWKRVISLSRMAVSPDVPKNACSFLLGRSCRLIKAERRFLSLVTYADEWQDHSGGVYLACGWQKIGEQKGSAKWVEPKTGVQVSRLSTKTRTDAQMRALGYVNIGNFGKVKFVRYLHDDVQSKLLRCSAEVEALTRSVSGIRRSL